MFKTKKVKETKTPEVTFRTLSSLRDQQDKLNKDIVTAIGARMEMSEGNDQLIAQLLDRNSSLKGEMDSLGDMIGEIT